MLRHSPAYAEGVLANRFSLDVALHLVEAERQHAASFDEQLAAQPGPPNHSGLEGCSKLVGQRHDSGVLVRAVPEALTSILLGVKPL